MVSTCVPLDDIFEWDVDNWSKCLPYWAPWLTRLDRNTTHILALGERAGGLSLYFALQGFHVLCTDYHLPSERVRLLHARWGVQERMTYAAVNAFHIPYPANAFDVVVCKSVIGGLQLERKRPESRTLPHQRLAVEEIRRVLKPGGLFFGAENLVGSPIHRGLRWLKWGVASGWRHLRPAEIQWLFANYAVCEQRQWGLVGAPWWKFGSHWWQCDRLHPLFRVLDAWLCPVLPGAWLYISFIRARK